ncbi:uncharacterized protein LOC124159505 [Ischnura elegans]|uniref:uncharacterized protein LOC124159505 n=1 Tax=Ischnura elegans TaxID=197161 RepID=UPI001ED89B5B|nr:uncharacterized protein LOC124159505 [Ischnura elegans]
MATFPRIPINPRLAFGESIESICPRGRLHPGLKELFTKAYFSAHQNECLIYDDSLSNEDKSSPGAWILTILKFAQGDVAVKLSLKRRLETGRWIMPLQVPPAAPLWLIRHFLGRLKTPLLLCHAFGARETNTCIKRWIELSKDCHGAMCQYNFNQKRHHLIQTKIAQAMDEMLLEACLTLISLITLIRNLSYEPIQGRIDKHAVKALIEYFVPSLLSRPYRPGFLTKDDVGCQPALCYLSYNLPEIQALCKRQATQNNLHLIFDSPSGASILDLHKKNGYSPSAKKVAQANLKFTCLKQGNPYSETTKRQDIAEPKTLCTPRRPNEVCQNDKLEPKTAAVPSPVLSELRNREEGLENLNKSRKELHKDISVINSMTPSKIIYGKADKETSTDFEQEYRQEENEAATIPTLILAQEGKRCTLELEKKSLQDGEQVLPEKILLKIESGKGIKEQSTETIAQNSEEKEGLNIFTQIEGVPEVPCVSLPLEYGEEEKNPLVDAIEYPTRLTTNFDSEEIPEKKCQAIKLAYKLRGQWLAWKLAGLFLDGATSHISGYGYAKLSHDAPF